MLHAMKIYYVYILSSRHHKHLSVRAVADLKHGVRHHRRAVSRRLAKKNVYQKLVYIEKFSSLSAAVGREREMRHWPRARLAELVTKCNPAWKAISVRYYLQRRAATLSSQTPETISSPAGRSVKPSFL